VIEATIKIAAISTGDSFNDQPIARGVGDTAADAIKTMWPWTWRTPRNE
jgi:hypothetical protein